MRKPTLADIARKAGVGTATVERVLNGRGGVRPAMAERVITAARALGYSRRLPEVHRGLVRIEIIFARPETALFRRLTRAFERISATLDPIVRIHRTFAKENDPAGTAALIASREHRRAGLILGVPDDPLIRAAVAESAPELPLIHVVTRAHDTIGDLVGIDNYAAGRSAAMFISRMQTRPGNVMAICHPIYHVHRERMRGFSDYFAEHPRADLAFSWTAFGRDNPETASELLFQALRADPGLAGLYNVGAANPALIDLLRRAPRPGLFYVGHELTEFTAAALRDGVMHVVLDQAPEAQARRAIDLMMNRLGLLDIPPDTAPIQFITLTAENVHRVQRS
ncbi:LacI family DNA-binding transcriptional regulator [Amaricoccus solimangrovi]|uniref:LacI family transcriptional regulator n=1 Tax=Amaricoccus solimangrovi TaxID=2589815 RepID=A0A501WT54_9RHOB|nr:LacI family DNA-binding transcriptional regulator [Amaricoccus solimangrovi]TPE52599.1 LacI family transcriptional regulator [Amaricoccus solimangrovi]